MAKLNAAINWRKTLAYLTICIWGGVIENILWHTGHWGFLHGWWLNITIDMILINAYNLLTLLHKNLLNP
jgi:hypothetical protein